ncbi:MAG: zinc dependent phospholipase C family protein [Clostridia bacterium]|nr:zinc dependent phospholipase C family protein [Clostridia bacterium]
MPGLVIHISVAKQYIKNNRNKIKNEEEFIRGAIAPDFNEDFTAVMEDKNKTHYGHWGKGGTYTDINALLRDKKVDMNKDYWKGYFIHLLADHCFFNLYFKKELKQVREDGNSFYYDYDSLNKYLLRMYKIKPTNEFLSKYMITVDKEPRYLKLDKIIEFINDIAEIDMDKTISLIEENGMDVLKEKFPRKE